MSKMASVQAHLWAHHGAHSVRAKSGHVGQLWPHEDVRTGPI
jgi:hypothetical protein